MFSHRTRIRKVLGNIVERLHARYVIRKREYKNDEEAQVRREKKKKLRV
jgi:hypothetical protein